MDFNLTLLGQMITFIIFVGFTMKYVWPPIMKAIKDREAIISEGLADAEKGKKELALSERRAIELVRQARQEAAQIIEHAHQHKSQVIEEAKTVAQAEGKRLLKQAQEEIIKERQLASDALKNQVVLLAVAGAERIIKKQIDVKAQNDILDDLLDELNA